MEKTLCPYCREEVKPEALTCEHCHTRLRLTREETLILAIQRRIDPAAYQATVAQLAPVITIGPVSPCKAWCHWKHRDNKPALNQCLDDCKAHEAEAIAMQAERMVEELCLSFIEVVWKYGGDIDPLPFEREIRERFSKPGKP